MTTPAAEPERETDYYLQLTPAQVRKLATADPGTIHECLVKCAEWVVDMDLGPFAKYAPREPVKGEKRARRTA